MPLQKQRRHIIFGGRVQGVGFRYRAYYLAQSLRLTGWVRNLWDDTVEMEIQGEISSIDRLMQGLSEGSYISIEWMDSKNIPLEKESCFTVR